MECFAVINIRIDHEAVEELKCLCTFPTEKEANIYAEEMKDASKISSKQRTLYTQQFVDGFQMSQKEKRELMYDLYHGKVVLEDYDPPEEMPGYHLWHNDLLVVQIK